MHYYRFRDKYDALLDGKKSNPRISHNHSDDSAIDTDMPEWLTDTREFTLVRDILELVLSLQRKVSCVGTGSVGNFGVHSNGCIVIFQKTKNFEKIEIVKTYFFRKNICFEPLHTISRKKMKNLIQKFECCVKC